MPPGPPPPHQNSFPRLIIQLRTSRQSRALLCQSTVSTTLRQRSKAIHQEIESHCPGDNIESICQRALPAHAPTSNADTSNHRAKSDETKASVQRAGVPVSLTTLFHTSTQFCSIHFYTNDHAQNVPNYNCTIRRRQKRHSPQQQAGHNIAI